MSYEAFLFWVIALLTCISAITVVLTQNIVRSAIWLLFALAGTASLFFQLGFEFIGAVQLFVYVGGTLVLVIFAVMLTAQGPFVNLKTDAGEWAITIVIGTLLYGLIAASIIMTSDWQPKRVVARGTVPQPWESKATERLGESLLGIEEATDDGDLLLGSKSASEKRERTKVAYLLPFEIVSVLLLVALVGAAYLARAKRRKNAGAV